MTRRLMLIINPVAGRRQVLRHIAEIIRIFMDYGCIVTTFVTQKPRDATAFVERYGRDFDIVVCTGGDGTLSETASGIVKSGAPVSLGYIPAGSTNVFASSHGISMNILTAAKDIATGYVKRIDTGRFNSRCFTFVAAVGAFSWLAYTTSQNLKNTIGYSAYVLDGMMSLPKIKPIPIRITTKDGTHEGDYLFGAVSNVTSFPGLLKFPPNTVKTNDGLFEMVLIREPENLVQWQTALNSVISGNYGADLIDFFQADEFTIHMSDEVHWALDGEYESGGTDGRIEIKSERCAVNLIVNRETP